MHESDLVPGVSNDLGSGFRAEMYENMFALLALVDGRGGTFPMQNELVGYKTFLSCAHVRTPHFKSVRS